ncbi:HCL386Wp [Eremothecium sinecaudum]|uniref:HCL386Wp n=1 Tax=Eremothecium sinecaudum TaxID=45286 RepID=A0A109UWB8_9SACH|nr:HCL386Wp [Eremothecium sinecaudum]AMD19765.1 HCL386Wp [Eremothecium sinecaudum]
MAVQRGTRARMAAFMRGLTVFNARGGIVWAHFRAFRQLRCYSAAVLSTEHVKEAVSTSVPNLRSYQQQCIDKCIEYITKRNKKRIGVSLATGGGKTVIFVNLAQQLRMIAGSRDHTTLIMLHRRELALQVCSTIKRFFPELNVQLEMAKSHADVQQADVIVASMYSLIRRLDKYPKDSINLIIIDEAHHAAADSYVEVLQHFRADTKDTEVPVVGFSATFERADRKALSRVMDEIVFHKGILEMIDEKWLCEGKFTTVDVNVDLSRVIETGDDFQPASLSRAMNTDAVNKIILKTYLHKRAMHNLKSTLLFGVDIDHVKSLCKLFQRHGIEAQYVTSKTRLSERDSIVQDFRAGKIDVLMNCGIFTEGTDIPNIDCLLLCRPTKSRTLLVQMIGRGLRQHHTKDHCQVIDFVSSCKVGVVSVPTLVGIDDYDNKLDDATIQDLKLMKDDIEKEQALIEQNKAERFQQEELEKERIHNHVQENMAELSALDLTLTSYEDFESFYKAAARGDSINFDDKAPGIKEIELLINSSYPWVRIGKLSWALDLGYGSHLRINKNKGGKADGGQCVYELKLYRRVSIHHLPIKFIPRVVSVSPDIYEIIASVENIIRDLKSNSSSSSISTSSRPRNFTKYSTWRRLPATERQKSSIRLAIARYFGKLSPGDRNQLPEDKVISKYLSSITRGDANMFLFSVSLAPVFSVSVLLKALATKASLNSRYL